MRHLFVIAAIAFGFILSSCCKDINANPTEISLYAGEQTQITTNNQKVSFTSEDDYFASVDESGLVTANKVGRTDIVIESRREKVSIPVNVTPRYCYFNEPFIGFGSHLDKIIELYGDCYASFNGEYAYVGYGPENAGLKFYFEDDALVKVKVTLNSTDGSIDIDSFMQERYDELTSTDKTQVKRYTNDLNGQSPAMITVYKIPEINIIDIEYKPFVSE